jgi:hypothetical protein
MRLLKPKTGSNPPPYKFKHLATPSNVWALPFERIEMNTETTENTNLLQEKLSEIQAAGTKYQLRTECRFDCESIRAILGPWLVSWKETSGYKYDDSHVDVNGVIWASMNWGSDTDVQFIVREDGPTLNEIRWFMANLTDCHVAVESLNTAEQYTGARIDYDLLESLQTRPSKAMIGKAMRSLAQRKQLCEISAAVAEDAWDALDEAVVEINAENASSNDAFAHKCARCSQARPTQMNAAYVDGSRAI